MTNIRKHLIAVAMLAVGVFLLAGCAEVPVRAYEGPELPENQVAKIIGYERPYNPLFEGGTDYVRIHAVDGKPLGDRWS